jgi:acyl dehydratase
VIDRKFAGLTLRPLTTRVPRDRVRAFARAIGETDPVHFDVDAARAAGYRDLLLPPTLLFGLELEQRGEELLVDMGLEPLRVLHAEQAFDYHLPVHAEEELAFSSRVADVYERGGLEFIVQETQVLRDSERAVDMRQVLFVNPSGVSR